MAKKANPSHLIHPVHQDGLVSASLGKGTASPFENQGARGMKFSWEEPRENHGGWATPLKNDGVRQLGWWHSQKIWEDMFQSTKQLCIFFE